MVLNKADKVLKGIGRMAKRKFLPIVGPKKGKILVDIVRKVKPKLVLEVGTLIGYSAILIGKELGSEAHLITIEIHAEEARKAEKNIMRAEIPPTAEVLIGDAIEIIPKLEGRFDLVFIDADARNYIDYLRLLEGKLHKGSIIVTDNAGIFASQMREYLDYVRSSGEFSTRYLPVDGDGLEISVKL